MVCFERVLGNSQGDTSTNGVVAVCGGGVVFCVEDVDSRQSSVAALEGGAGGAVPALHGCAGAGDAEGEGAVDVSVSLGDALVDVEDVFDGVVEGKGGGWTDAAELEVEGLVGAGLGG